MKWKTANGAEFELPDRAAVDKTIADYEEDLRQLRRIRGLMDDLSGNGKKKTKSAAPPVAPGPAVK